MYETKNMAKTILSVAKIFGLLIQALLIKKNLLVLILVYPCIFCFLLSTKHKIY
jgi:hypothetical protein